MGGHRAGKSSMLAALFDVMLSDDIRKLVTVQDVTQGNPDSLSRKVENLKNTLRKNCGKVIMMDTGKTDKFRPYSLQFTIPGTGHSMNITFTDVNGEYYTHHATYAQERQVLETKVKESDIILVAVDTVYLMGDNDAMNLMANCVDSIQALLTNLKLEEKAKLVAYVPIKCERWTQDGHNLDEVTSKVEKVYADSITSLKASPLVEILVLPVLTVGNIVFKEQLPAYVYNATGHQARCSLIDKESKLRFADGSVMGICENDTKYIVEDSTAFFHGTSIEQPNTWFFVSGAQYMPKNCEQLAYHILRYMLNRSIDAERAKSKGKQKLSPWVKWGLAIAAIAAGQPWLFAAAVAAFLYDEKMGNVSVNELENLVQKLTDHSYIKDSGDGIKIIQKYKKIYRA